MRLDGRAYGYPSWVRYGEDTCWTADGPDLTLAGAMELVRGNGAGEWCCVWQYEPDPSIGPDPAVVYNGYMVVAPPVL